ncbi:hypothetical protein K7X08_006063 [Anisodus acutangulus]|uniref:U1-type domain-containing protein n=1 Tax=Anisodus acutangulus TaxID=402998 RepID=A0A9Q1LUF9_9SOLA|nr:hypothetical protein K7X08_006063 [Anisodus acutangulus]
MRLLLQAGQSLDRGGGQCKGGGRDKTKRDRLMTKNYPERSPIDSKSSNSAGVGRCELCKVDCGGMDKLKQHESGKRHKRNLKKLEADENWKPAGRQRKGVGSGKPSKPAGVGRCEVCKLDTGSVGILKHHEKGKQHKRNLQKLEENENITVSDFQDVQKPSGDLKPGTTMNPDNLLVGEETKRKPAENIPLDTVPSENKLETEQKINNAQQAENQMRGVKRKTLVGGGKKKEVSKAKRLAIGPSNH